MENFTLSQIATVTGGKLVIPDGIQHHKISQIVTDSRTFFKRGETLFFALTGPRNNGHDYIPELIKKGLKAFVVSETAALRNDAIFIVVNNTLAALQKLAAFNRKRYHYPVVGITGSNGKTIVKEWLHDLLAGEINIVRNPKSYNSQTGVPLSVLLMTEKYNLAIFEAGISQPGEMENLSKIIDPEIGILTNIGDAHQENFKTLREKIQEKLLLFRNSKKLVYCVDAEELKTETEQFCTKNSIQKISWSLKRNEAFISFTAVVSESFTSISASVNQQEYHFRIPFTDPSSLENACHCFAASLVILEDFGKILPEFEKLEPVAMRLEIKQGINQCLLINDFYNSDLHSLTIALSVLNQQAAKEHLHKLVILSDIQQTGIPANELYPRVNEMLGEWNIDEMIGIGPVISRYFSTFNIKKSFYRSTEEFENEFSREKIKQSAILIKGARQFTFEKISDLLQQKAHQTVLEINLNALVNNMNVFRGLLQPKTKMMVMVKAFSYGSGDVEIAKTLEYQNVNYLAVAVADEGVQLRNAGIQTPVIVMNPEQHSFQNMLDYRLEPNLYSNEILDNFMAAVSHQAITGFPVHLKLETGMHRLGFDSKEEIQLAIRKISSGNRIKIVSVFSHLAASDEPDLDQFTRRQIELFEEKSEMILSAFPYPIDRHILNSAGIERFPGKQFEMVRLGIGLYGISNTGLPLQTISKLKSVVSQVKEVAPDETIGYGRKGQIHQKSQIAVVPLGYADGLDRKLGNGNGTAFINGNRIPIIGNICMDMLMLDVTGIQVKPGDEVEFFGSHISISEVAEKAGTIPYEILTGISQRVKRIYIHE